MTWPRLPQNRFVGFCRVATISKIDISGFLLKSLKQIPIQKLHQFQTCQATSVFKRPPTSSFFLMTMTFFRACRFRTMAWCCGVEDVELSILEAESYHVCKFVNIDIENHHCLQENDHLGNFQYPCWLPKGYVCSVYLEVHSMFTLRKVLLYLFWFEHTVRGIYKDLQEGCTMRH